MPKYSAKQRKMRGIAGTSKRQFLQLYRNVKRSTAYHSLNHYARCLLFELIDRYTGSNNGMIGLGVREARYELGCSAGAISNAMRELDDVGLARPMKVGAWCGKQATEWRLMFLRCDKTGDLPVTQWEQRMPYSEFTQRNTKVHEREHREGLSSRGRTQTTKNPMNEHEPSSPGDTHIDIYQGEGVAERRAGVQPASPGPSEAASQFTDAGQANRSNNFRPPDNCETTDLDTTDTRVRSLENCAKNARRRTRRWTKPSILSDEPRDFERWRTYPWKEAYQQSREG